MLFHESWLLVTCADGTRILLPVSDLTKYDQQQQKSC